jgi:hypothetical protein
MPVVFKMESLRFWFTLNPQTGKWQMSLQDLTGKRHEKESFDTAEEAMQWTWERMWAQARTASTEQVEDVEDKRLVDAESLEP